MVVCVVCIGRKRSRPQSKTQLLMKRMEICAVVVRQQLFWSLCCILPGSPTKLWIWNCYIQYICIEATTFNLVSSLLLILTLHKYFHGHFINVFVFPVKLCPHFSIIIALNAYAKLPFTRLSYSQPGSAVSKHPASTQG